MNTLKKTDIKTCQECYSFLYSLWWGQSSFTWSILISFLLNSPIHFPPDSLAWPFFSPHFVSIGTLGGWDLLLCYLGDLISHHGFRVCCHLGLRTRPPLMPNFLLCIFLGCLQQLKINPPTGNSPSSPRSLSLCLLLPLVSIISKTVFSQVRDVSWQPLLSPHFSATLPHRSDQSASPDKRCGVWVFLFPWWFHSDLSIHHFKLHDADI